MKLGLALYQAMHASKKNMAYPKRKYRSPNLPGFRKHGGFKINDISKKALII
jgi:hypothetical protein